MTQLRLLFLFFYLFVAFIGIIFYLVEAYQKKSFLNETLFGLLGFLFLIAGMAFAPKAGYWQEGLLLISVFFSLIPLYLRYRNKKNKVKSV